MPICELAKNADRAIGYWGNADQAEGIADRVEGIADRAFWALEMADRGWRGPIWLGKCRSAILWANRQVNADLWARG
jgi:hypothetical protein